MILTSFVLLATLNSASAESDRVAAAVPTVETPRPSSSTAPALRDLNSCAAAISDRRFGGRGEALITWRLRDQTASPLLSTYLEHGLDDRSPGGFLTWGANRVYFTEATVDLNPAPETPRGTRVTLALDDGETADRRVYWRGPNLRMDTYETRGAIDGARTAVTAPDRLTGDPAAVALARVTNLLRERLATTPDNSELSEDSASLTSRQIRQFAEGLCGCEPVFPNEVRDVRRRLINGGRVRAWEQHRYRALDAADLACGSV